MKVAILGGGAVGLALAASLATIKDFRVSLLLRGGGAAALRSEGLRVEKPDGSVLVIAPEALEVIDNHAPGPLDLACDVLFLATKAYQVADVLEDLMWRTDDGRRPGAIVLLQNGWGFADEARRIVPPRIPVFNGVVLAGLTRRDVNHVKVNGVSAPLAMGSLFAEDKDPLTALAEKSSSGLLPLAVADDIRSNVLQKLLLNTTLNATCSLTDLTYGELLTLEVVRPLALSVAREALDVLAHVFRFNAFASATSFLDDHLLPLIVPRTATHRPSMAQDIRERRETEIDYLNGAIVRLAVEHGLSAPVNESLTAMIKARSRRAG
ncbi:ketopantoate reductase family protein [Rhizobium sp. YIM 134829]|uniref:ketopantoate reductase family protein n=1 Tax=Rhizobium sp. YIM 134829 TaxID=3390453 RepID=UPI00397E811E